MCRLGWYEVSSACSLPSLTICRPDFVLRRRHHHCCSKSFVSGLLRTSKPEWRAMIRRLLQRPSRGRDENESTRSARTVVRFRGATFPFAVSQCHAAMFCAIDSNASRRAACRRPLYCNFQLNPFDHDQRNHARRTIRSTPALGLPACGRHVLGSGGVIAVVLSFTIICRAAT
jgi:hypothetical protein